ncbi:MAG: hypothetical protein QF371_05280, partial [Flavobacteriales bacterium]|nr:hypothetical protein [Flavobacteriales bacterium]
MRKQETVFIRPTREVVMLFWQWVAIVLGVFLVTYLLANEMAAENPQRYEMYADWELNIPLVPWMIVVYLS